LKRSAHQWQLATRILLCLTLYRWRFRVLDLDLMRRSDEKPLLSEFNALLKNLCHFVLATWAFTGALIMPRSVGKDVDQHHSCAALGTRRTGDHAWRITNIRSHFSLPTLQIVRSPTTLGRVWQYSTGQRQEHAPAVAVPCILCTTWTKQNIRVSAFDSAAPG